QDFVNGVNLLSKLTSGKVFVCTAADSVVRNFEGGDNPQVKMETFSGVHPAGNVGTHIHFLHPVSAGKTVWHIGYQDVIAIGRLFLSGQLPVERVISLAGPLVEKPRLLKTRLGARVEDLVAGQIREGKRRVISGSVFGGRTALGVLAYLGRYHQQLSVLEEQSKRDFLHYLHAGRKRFSVLPIYISSLLRNKTFNFTTTTGGSERAMVPLGTYEKVMPLDILPTQLLRALIVGDTETAQNLGCLELDEEDLALCTYVCPGKYEYGPILRDNLTRIELEG
ncbi:MAG: NADH:ubiquinone reductase (Na(+)-transporting) subunit A, partial [Natronospirillum sp.]